MNTIFCPRCEKTTEIEYIKTVEEIEVRGEPISVPAEFLKCLSCGEEFDDPNSKQDPLIEAYREYRRRHEMMQPEEIRELRRRYGLTQKDLSKLLGWGDVTLSRYENGALQDNTHDTILKMVKEPHNLLTLIERKGEFISEQRRQHITALLQSEVEETHSFPYIYAEVFGRYASNILSGFKKLDIDKVFQSIIFFCEGGAVKTKLNKLLFYLDFKHFKDYALSITGLRYVHLEYGPVPDNYEHYYATLLNDENAIRIEEEFNGYDLMDLFYPNKTPDLSIFNESEIKTLMMVKDFFKTYNATAIKNFSHEEKGYKETPDRQIIPYSYADNLKI
jgi:putative zinc finger/helix-turn-helix YgiT family protein